VLPSRPLLLSSILGAVLAIPYAAQDGPAQDGRPLALVQKSCTGCHNASLASGGVNLTELSGVKSFTERREIWERVSAKLKAGEMPPPGAPRPLAAEIDAVTSWLEAEFERQDRAAKPDAGRVTARRLNRAEYNNTVRDLLGVDVRPADNFPQDESAFGFDNIGDALNVSPALLEKYVDAAERAVRTALFGPEKLKPAMTHYSAAVRIPVLPKSFEGYDLTGLTLPSSTHAIHRFPADGEYSFRVVLNGHRPNQSEPVHVGFWIDSKLVNEQEVDATDLEGQTREFRTQVAAGSHLLSATYMKDYHGLPPSYKGPEPSKRQPGALITMRGQFNEKDLETLRKLGTTIKLDRIETRVDNRFESFDVGGPFTQTSGPSAESLKRIFVCGHAPGKHATACSRTIVADFAKRAFRRPVTPVEVNSYLGLVDLVRKQGDSFEEGIAAALEAILVSPQFLFRIERDRPAVAGRTMVAIGDYEMASRLSYFLWSSMPDAELLRVAGLGQLRQPAVLTAQVKRMLKDPKSAALVENFGGQWLQFKNIDVQKPDPEKFPEFDEYLRRSMRRETELFFENIIRQDRSILDFLNASYSYLDERLARFYGVPGVTGPEFRQVDMSATKRGGGLLAQASILTVSSYATRTSPVLRGKWILENLLNAPPPPPPPAVPALDDTKIGQEMTLRQQMEEHRKNAICAGCHSKMDPLGFGLENLSAIGAWRDADGKLPIDSAGTLPGGRQFKGPVELKLLLAADRDAFVRGVSEKLLTYALGRGLEKYDRPALAAITQKLPLQNYKFSELVLGIVNSLPFQNRRAKEVAPGVVAQATKQATKGDRP
jgi:mono/diheme cytochrome c family protein